MLPELATGPSVDRDVEVAKRDTTFDQVRREVDTAIDELTSELHLLVDHVDPFLTADPRDSVPSDALVYATFTSRLRSLEDTASRVRGLAAFVGRIRNSVEV